MKAFTIAVILCLVGFTSRAQNKLSDKIYWAALDKYTLSLDSNKLKSANEDKVKTIYLEKANFIDSIPVAMNGYKIVAITSENQWKLYKEHNKYLIHTIIFPVKISNNIAVISFIPYHGKLKGRKHYYLGVSDGTNIHFKFDCNLKQFVFERIENWGI